MIRQLDLTLIFMLGLDVLMSTASACISEMLGCTRQMTDAVRTAENRSTLCGVMHTYMNCIECSCNVSLTLCDISNARGVIASLLKDYGLQCEFYVPPQDDYCSASMTTKSTSSILVLYATLAVCYILSFRRL